MHERDNLSPSALENVGLDAALEYALADAVAHLPPEKRFEYECTCDEGLEEKLKISPAIQIQIYRICQEAISNVCRHADARRVKLSVGASDGAFALTLEDDGCGFDSRSKRARTGGSLQTYARGQASSKPKSNGHRWKASALSHAVVNI